MRDTAYQTLGYSQLLTVKDVRDLLGVSYELLYELIRDKRLSAVSISGHPIYAEHVDERSRSLRFYPSDVRDFIRSNELR